MIALLEARKAGLYKLSNWPRNVVAGLVVGVVALPLSMAFAIASGARPEQGIYTGIIAGLLVTLFGGSRVQIAGPTGAFIAVLAGITAKYGIDGLQIATLLAGLMLLAMGLLRMGGVIRFIPAPVIMGFTAGIGIIIFTGQWAYFLGLPQPTGELFHQKFWSTLQSLGSTHWPTVLIGGFSLFILIAAPKVRWLQRVPAPLIVLIIATLLQTIFRFDGVATIGSAFGGIPQGLPSFEWPALSFDKVTLLIAPAFTIAMLGAIESLLSAVVADRMINTRHSSNQELIGQGIANIVVPFFGGFAATGAIARTATNIRNGGDSPIAGIFHALLLVGVIVALAPLAYNVPLASLSAVLFIVAWNMSEIPRVWTVLKRAPAADRVILVVTLLLTVFVDLVVAVNAGVILAILQFLRRMAQSVRVRTIEEDASFRLSRVEGPLFFAAVGMLESAAHGLPSGVKLWVLDLSRVSFADDTALQALEDVVKIAQQKDCKIVLADANDMVLKKLRSYGVLKRLGKNGYLKNLSDIETLKVAVNTHHESLAATSSVSA